MMVSILSYKHKNITNSSTIYLTSIFAQALILYQRQTMLRERLLCLVTTQDSLYPHVNQILPTSLTERSLLKILNVLKHRGHKHPTPTSLVEHIGRRRDSSRTLILWHLMRNSCTGLFFLFHSRGSSPW